jgi:hypothetical protein
MGNVDEGLVLAHFIVAETTPVRDPLLHPRPDGHLIEVGQTTDPEGDWSYWPLSTSDEEPR